MRGSLTLRLLVAFWLALVVTLVLTLLITQQMGRYRALTALDPDTLADAVTAAQYRGREGMGAVHRRLRHRGFRLLLMRDSRPLPPELQRWRQRLIEAAPGVVELPRGRLAVVVEIIAPDGQPYFAVALRRDDARPVIAPTLAMGLQLLVSLLVITAVAAWMARRLTRPVRAIQTAVRQFADGDLAARVPATATNGSDDLAALARDFDAMAGRIQALVTDRDRLLHDVSHELRSPLARMRLALELARSGQSSALDRCDEDVQRIDELVEEVLTFARLDPAHRGASVNRLDLQPLSLLQLAQDAVDRHLIAAQEQSLQLEVGSTADDVTVKADLRLLDRALDNLIGNALRYAQDTIRIELLRQDSWIEIAVVDDGPGVEETALPHLFEPFWRGAAQPDAGYGLGLALVERVARAHQGRVVARNIDPAGFRIALQLPSSLHLHDDAPGHPVH